MFQKTYQIVEFSQARVIILKPQVKKSNTRILKGKHACYKVKGGFDWSVLSWHTKKMDTFKSIPSAIKRSKLQSTLK